jgi:hypothetical protein
MILIILSGHLFNYIKKEFTKKQHRYICHMMNHSYEENNKDI